MMMVIQEFIEIRFVHVSVFAGGKKGKKESKLHFQTHSVQGELIITHILGGCCSPCNNGYIYLGLV